MMKNQIVDGVEVAPAGCVVCGKPHPGGQDVPGWTYFAGTTPPGAISCSDRCRKTAIGRHQRTGRVDVPAMRVLQ